MSILTIPVYFKLEDILIFIKNKDFSFLDNEEINIIKTTTDNNCVENILIELSDKALFEKFDILINKNILKLKNDYNHNIIFILEFLLERNCDDFLSYLYNANKYDFHFSTFKENTFYLEKFLRSSIFSKNDNMFFYFYHEKENQFIEPQDLIYHSILNNRQEIYKTLVDNENFYTLQYFISNTLLQYNVHVFFFKDYFQRLKDNNIEWTKIELYNFLSETIKNTECFIFIFNLFQDINNFRICELMEKAIKAHNYDIICFLNSKITFRIFDYDYDFIITFLESYKNDTGMRVFFENIEHLFIEKDNKINILKCLINNPNIFNIEKDMNNLVYLILQKFDLDIIEYLIKNFNLLYEAKDEISKIRLQESFFKGVNSENKFLSYENILFVVDFFNINLYYRENVYLYKFINKLCSQEKLLNNVMRKNHISIEEYKKIINYFLNNEDVFINFNIRHIDNRNKPEIFDFINNKLKFQNF